MQRTGVMVLCIILPDNRVLLHRIAPTGDTPEAWGITQEVYLPANYNINSPTRAAVTLLREYYGVNPGDKNDGTLLREGAISIGAMRVFPYVYHVNGMFSFSTYKEEQHMAVPWDDLYDAITTQAILNETGATQKQYTTVSMHAVAEVHITGHFELCQK